MLQHRDVINFQADRNAGYRGFMTVCVGGSKYPSGFHEDMQLLHSLELTFKVYLYPQITTWQYFHFERESYISVQQM